MSVPPFLLAFVGERHFLEVPSLSNQMADFVWLVSVVGGYASDRIGRRGVIATMASLTSIIGFSLYYGKVYFSVVSILLTYSNNRGLSGSHNARIRYASLFFSLPGSICVIPALTTWLAINVGPSRDRAIALALKSCVNCLGSVLSVWIFGSDYEEASRICVWLSVGATFGCIGCIWYMNAANDRREKARNIISGDDTTVGAVKEEGDRSIWFRYTL